MRKNNLLLLRVNAAALLIIYENLRRLFNLATFIETDLRYINKSNEELNNNGIYSELFPFGSRLQFFHMEILFTLLSYVSFGFHC